MMSEIHEMAQPPWVNDVSRHPLVTPRVKEIATLLFERLVSGKYPFGTRIPAERELAVEFRDTRATIRQSLEFLAIYDVVSRRPGSGTFASYRGRAASEVRTAAASPGYLNVDQLAETTSPFAMNVAGSILEPEMIRLATIYMSRRDLAELRDRLSDLEAIVTEFGQVRAARRRVHDDDCARHPQFTDRRDVRDPLRSTPPAAVGRQPKADAHTVED